MTYELPKPPRKVTGGQIVAYILITVGLMVMLASGGCSLMVIGSMGFDTDLLGLVALYGGIPFFIGLSLVLAGRRMLRDSAR